MKYFNVLIICFLFYSNILFSAEKQRVIVIQNYKNQMRSYCFESNKIFEEKLFLVATNIVDSAVIDLRYRSIIKKELYAEVQFFENKIIYLIGQVYCDLCNLFLENKLFLPNIENDFIKINIASGHNRYLMRDANWFTFVYGNGYIVPHVYAHLAAMFGSEPFNIVLETDREVSIYSYLLHSSDYIKECLGLKKESN